MSEHEPHATRQAEAGFYSEGWTDHWQDMRRYAPVGRHTRRWILKLLRRLPPPGSLCDFGAGDGALLAELARSHPQARLYGTDFSEAAVALCHRRLPQAVIRQHDLRAPSPPFGELLDVGICSEVIEHIDDHEAAIRTITQGCRHLVITVPSGPLDDISREIGHLRHYDVPTLTRLVEAAGHQVVVAKTWGAPLAYPWYASLRNRAGYATVTGRYGPGKQLVSHLLYGLFFLNDLFDGGNKLFMLSRQVESRPAPVSSPAAR